MKPVIVFDLAAANPILKEGVKSDLKRVDDFFVRVGTQLYNALNVCEDTTANRAAVTETVAILKDLDDQRHRANLYLLKHVGISK